MVFPTGFFNGKGEVVEERSSRSPHWLPRLAAQQNDPLACC